MPYRLPKYILYGHYRIYLVCLEPWTPNAVVSADLNTFKSRLGKVWYYQDLKFDWKDKTVYNFHLIVF